ncbi:MAG: hypothetical protein ACLFUA_12675 [Spirochaetales bacterium]
MDRGKKHVWLLAMAVVLTAIVLLGCDIGTGSQGGQTDGSADDSDTDPTGEPDEPEVPDEELGYIIADHSVVADYASIPDEYLTVVKGRLVDAAGESHSQAYRTGMDGSDSLEQVDARFQAVAFDGGLPAPSSDGLRIGRHGSVGEEDFWTNVAARDDIKALIAQQHADGNPIHVILQAWCWDFTRTTGAAGNGTNAVDLEYGCRWYGSSSGGPEGDHIWGLDSSDFEITGNSVSLQTYLDAIDDYNDYCFSNGYETVAVFTTGPVDGQSADGEQGYQRYVKHERIREHVRAGEGRVLFDYADILAYNDAGERHMEEWDSHSFPAIHPDNDGEQTGHIGHDGALRLAKAMWWMLARMAGWDGTP